MPVRPNQLNYAALAVIAGLAIMGCAIPARQAGPHAGIGTVRPVRRSLPASSHGARLIVGVDERNLPAYRVNLQIHLLARSVFREVRVTLTSPDSKLAVPSGCTFPVLRPPIPPARRGLTAPLPVIPLCSLVLSARTSGTYPLDLRVLDGSGISLAPPMFVWVRIRVRSGAEPVPEP